MNILVPLGNFLGAAVGPLAKRVMSSLGLGYLSYAAVTIIMEQAIQFAKDHYLGLAFMPFTHVLIAFADRW